MPRRSKELGAMYGNGDGVPEDDAAAYAWYSLSAASGHDDALAQREILKRDLTPEQLEKGETMAREISKPLEKQKAEKAE